VAPDFPNLIIVGQTNVPTILRVTNASSGVGPVTLGQIGLSPACGTISALSCANPDPGVITLSTVGTGQAGTGCAGVNFAISGPDTNGRYVFTPSAPIVLALPGNPGDSCTISYTFNVLKAPTFDAGSSPGLQTGHFSSVTASGMTLSPPIETIAGGGVGTSVSTVALATAALSTNASPTAALGQAISDTATLTAPSAPVVQPTGTITFRLFGPNDTTCSGTAVFTSAPVTVAGAGTYPSGPFTPTTVGTYRWKAAYSGDANYDPITTSCNDANETSVVGPATPGLTTTATPTVGVGQPISDMATLTAPAGVTQPTGTIIFTLFGPNDASCTGTAVFTSLPVTVAGAGTYASGSFTPTTVGTYRWRAAYSGDGNYNPISTACNDTNETTVVNQATPTLTTTLTATNSPTLGNPIHDTATIGGLVNPTTTGTITFNVYGPNNATCTGTPIFTSTVTVANGNGNYLSGDFTPTVAGSYQVVAVYSGDLNNAGIRTACNDTNETLVVNLPVAGLTTNATVTAAIGQPIMDTATLTAPAPPVVQPTGTITFTLFGPNDATCATPALFTSAPVAVTGAGSYPSPTFTPTLIGTYRWRAAYSGDNVYAAVTTACNDTNETSTITKVPPGLTTTATPTVAFGQPISDTAALTAPAGVAQPTGTITFTLFGPNDATCTGTAVFTSAPVTVAGAGAYASGSFTPTAPGTYRWRAAYSGDVNYGPVTTACNDTNETSVVNKVTPTLTTTLTATGPATVGNPIHDTATIGGLVNPTTTGTITFNVYGPNNATCTGTPIFVSTVTVANGNGTYVSGNFTPTAPGSYQVIAVYSGDVNNAAVTTSCNDTNETLVVAGASTTSTTPTSTTPTTRPPTTEDTTPPTHSENETTVSTTTASTPLPKTGASVAGLLTLALGLLALGGMLLAGSQWVPAMQEASLTGAASLLGRGRPLVVRRRRT